MKYFPKIASAKFLMSVTVLAIVISIVCITSMRNSKTATKDRLYEYTQDFFNRYAERGNADSIQRQLLADAGENIKDDSTFYNDLRLFGRKMFEKGDQMIAFEYLKQVMTILDDAESHDDDEMQRYKAYCYLLLGAASDEVGLPSLSQGYYFSGMKVADDVGDSDIKNDFHNNLGVSMYRTGNTEQAELFYNKALLGARSQKNDGLLFIVYNNLAEIYADRGNFPKAIDYMLKSIQTVDVKKHPEEYYSSQTALGSLYFRNKDYPMAYSYLSNAYRNLDSLGNKSFLYDASLFLVDYFSRQAKADSTSKYISVAWRMADLTNNPDYRIRLLKKEADLTLTAGDYQKSVDIVMKLLQMKDSLHNVENSQRIERANRIYELEKRTFENKSRIERWNPVIVFVAMSVIVLLLMSFVIWIIVIKRRSDRINEEKTRAAAELSELRERQLNEERERKAKQEEELRLFNQKLASFTLERIKTNGQIEEIATDMKKALLNVSPRDRDQQSLLKEVIRKMTMLQSDTQWDEFQYYFEKVHPDFYARLDARHPDLTAKDRRLCALLSLGLSTKDIASITNLEVRSVESSRNRLRKKLGLENDQNLFDYIRTI